MEIAVAPAGDAWHLAAVDGAWRRVVPDAELASVVRELETSSPRWVWQDSRHTARVLIARGAPVERCRDVRLSHRILADRGRDADARWMRSLPEADGALFSLGDEPQPIDAVLAEYAAQCAIVAADPDRQRIELLLGAESTGALIAAELHATGLPFSVAVHDRILTEALGPRPASGRPARMEALVGEIRAVLGDATVNPDSPPELLRALRRHGLDVRSTSRWALRHIEHPVVEPLIAYKRLARLHTANGWAWANEWVRDGRFHADYVPGGVVTGRWATSGGGAMQIARRVRAAVVATPGHMLVVADAAQLEPRVLAGLSRDAALADAARGADLYEGLVEHGVVDTRVHAKYAMLGALYGATTGEAGRLAPSLKRAYPAAMGAVEAAARAGERGERVRTWLGRTSPLPARIPVDEGLERVAASRERAWGRFTRNFIVQGSAAEWALCWMAMLRQRLRAIPGAELVYFLHDEVIVHTPAERAEETREAVVEAAASAGRLLFGTFPIEFPVEALVVADYGQAKG